LPVSVPQAAPVQPVPLRVQVTPALFTSLVTVAARARFDPPLSVVLAGGVMVTMAGGTVSTMEVLAAGFVMEVALMVTVSWLAGGCVGAT